MNIKQAYFSRFILLIVIFSSLSLVSGCHIFQPSDSDRAAYAKQAKELAPATGKLTVAIQAIIEYPPLSEGLSDEQILQYIYTEKPELGKVFSGRKVQFSRVDKHVEVTVYADDQKTALIVDSSSTPEIDFIYKGD
ncbi:MAG: hypothetical protein FWD62_14415 [Betaproteobacteria bacterium]|nr:hypothetical protein [Betaproteobacteria bacterium]